ncbi:MAG: TadE family protein [Bellilinea sp.]
MKHRLFSHNEKGQSLVELALIIVFVLIILAGVVDLGRMMYEYLTMRDAAQEGAGYAAIYPNYCDETVNRVFQNLPDKKYSVFVWINNMGCQAAADSDLLDSDGDGIDNGCAGKEVKVTLDHDFEITMPLISVFTGQTVPMHVEIKDNIVRPKCN